LNRRLQEDGHTTKKFFFGASVNPNRKDWKDHLNFVINETDAVLLKLIPSAQAIDLREDKHKAFYAELHKAKLPLLCHVGPEYSFPEAIHNHRLDLDNFQHLTSPLECGVTVIAAHCAAPVFPLIDKYELRPFRKFMESHNRESEVKLWADTSALSLATRIPFIREIVRKFNPEWPAPRLQPGMAGSRIRSTHTHRRRSTSPLDHLRYVSEGI